MKNKKASLADIGRAFRSIASRKGLSTKRVAQAANLSVAQLVEIEQGRSKASLAVYQRVARALGTTLADVAKGGGVPEATAKVVRLGDVAAAVLRLQVDGSKVEAVTNAVVYEALKETGYNQSAAARMLGMERKAFCRRLARARRSLRGEWLR